MGATSETKQNGDDVKDSKEETKSISEFVTEGEKSDKAQNSNDLEDTMETKEAKEQLSEEKDNVTSDKQVEKELVSDEKECSDAEETKSSNDSKDKVVFDREEEECLLTTEQESRQNGSESHIGKESHDNINIDLKETTNENNGLIGTEDTQSDAKVSILVE